METAVVITPAPTWTNSEVLQKAWDGIKGNLPFTATLSLVYGIGVLTCHLFPFVGLLLFAPLAAGYLQCLLSIRRGGSPSFRDFFWGFLDANRLLQLILIYVLVSFGSFLGCFLFLVPCIWFSVAAYFSSTLFILGSETDAIAAIKKSLAIVKGHWWKYAGFMGVLLLLNLAGFICFVLGLLVSLPLSALAVVVVLESANANARPPAHQ